MLSQSCFVWPLFPGQLNHVAGLSIPETRMAFDEEMLPVESEREGSDGAEHEPGAPSGDDGDSSDAQPDADMGRARRAGGRRKKYSPSRLINFLRLSRLLDKL